MTNKLTDAEIKKAWWSCNQGESSYICLRCPLYDDEVITRECAENLKAKVLDLINRQEEKIKTLQDKYRWLDQESDILKADVENLNRICDEVNAENQSLKAEVERLKNAYKQCAWERDVFAEDIKEEIKKDCSYLMLDIKTIKAEAYKEFAEKLKEKHRRITDYDEAGFGCQIFIVEESYIDNLLNELVGDNNE